MNGAYRSAMLTKVSAVEGRSWENTAVKRLCMCGRYDDQVMCFHAVRPKLLHTNFIQRQKPVGRGVLKEYNFLVRLKTDRIPAVMGRTLIQIIDSTAPRRGNVLSNGASKHLSYSGLLIT